MFSLEVSWLLQSSLLVFALAVAGGLVPPLLSRTDRIQHLLIAFATGVFLGVVFLHLLPEVSRMTTELEDGALGAELWLFVLGGVVGLFLVENLAFHRRAHKKHGAHDHGRHKTVEYATLFGLSVHAFTSGVGLSAAVEVEELRSPLLLSVVSHKAVEGFSLAAVSLLAGATRRRAVTLVALFALVTPLGAVLGSLVVGRLDGTGIAALTAVAAGTFLFVALCDLLPEVFHHHEDTWPKIALLAAGVGIGLALHLTGS